MKHYFDTEIAKTCGINAAVVFENIKFWIEHNRKTGRNEKDGKHWMYQTQAELSEQFDYLSVKQVRTALAKLEEAGYIIKGNYNRHKYDRTTWYTLGECVEVLPEVEAVEAVEEPKIEAAQEPEKKNAQDKRLEPRRARENGGRYNHRGRKQKPVWANPEPIWLHGRAEGERPIPVVNKDDKTKDKLIQRMRKLAADCGAVCTV